MINDYTMETFERSVALPVRVGRSKAKSVSKVNTLYSVIGRLSKLILAIVKPKSFSNFNSCRNYIEKCMGNIDFNYYPQV